MTPETTKEPDSPAPEVAAPDVISYTHEETCSYTVSRERVLELLGIPVPPSALLSSAHAQDGSYTVFVQTQSTGVMA